MEDKKKVEKNIIKQKTSPQYIQTSLAASLTLGFQSGSFHRNAKLKGLNLLLHYEEGCLGKCHFCGLSKARREGPKGKTFIRVDWPLYPLEEIIQRAKGKDQIHRVCISMITHPKALEDTLYVTQRLREETDLYISVLISPTLIPRENLLEWMKKRKKWYKQFTEDRPTEPTPISSLSSLRKEARWRNIPHLLSANTGESSLPAGLLTRVWAQQ